MSVPAYKWDGHKWALIVPKTYDGDSFEQNQAYINGSWRKINTKQNGDEFLEIPYKKIMFSDGIHHAVVSIPVFGYKASILFPWDVTRRSDGKYAMYDHGAGYDIRQCTCDFKLDETEQEILNDFLSDSSRGRGRDINMTLNTGSGFYPFGPDKGDAGLFDVSVKILSSGRASVDPWKYFKTTLLLTKGTGDYPSYSLIDDTNDFESGNGTSDDGFKIGTVTGLRFPENYFNPSDNYSVFGTIKHDGSAAHIDNGSGGDSYQTSFSNVYNTSKAQKLIQYLATTKRTETFTVVTPNNYYLFGRDKGGSGTYTARLIQSSIEITHANYNQFLFDLSLGFEA